MGNRTHTCPSGPCDVDVHHTWRHQWGWKDRSGRRVQGKRGYHRLAGGPHLTSQACGLAVASTASHRLGHDNSSDGYGSGWGFGHPFFRSQRKGKRHLRTDQSIERSESGILEKDSHRSQRGRSHVHGCSLKGGKDLVHLGSDPLAPDPTVHISNREL